VQRARKIPPREPSRLKKRQMAGAKKKGNCEARVHNSGRKGRGRRSAIDGKFRGKKGGEALNQSRVLVRGSKKKKEFGDFGGGGGEAARKFVNQREHGKGLNIERLMKKGVPRRRQVR